MHRHLQTISRNPDSMEHRATSSAAKTPITAMAAVLDMNGDDDVLDAVGGMR